MTVSPFARISLFFCAISLFAAGPATEAGVGIQVDQQAFKDYWYQGKAEISRYQLKQARYGEIHEGDAVMIFVTEDFLAKKQVKHEFGNEASYPILKLNATRTFNTGLYPYSLMTSTFTKVDFSHPETAKVTFTGQEWCGHVFMQLNRKAKSYDVQHFSYFQAEGDQSASLPLVPLEDHIWTQIRMAPNTLPMGNLKMLPSLLFSRLLHKPYEPMKVKASLDETQNKTFGSGKMYRYTLAYTDAGRQLDIYFEMAAPYKILGWKDAFKNRAKNLETVAVRTHEVLSDYWSKNKNRHRPLRSDLGLD